MQILIVHMHGLGDMIMFVPTFNKLPQQEKKIDLLIFENTSVSPLLNSKKIRNIYYCNSSYLKFCGFLFYLLKYKYETILFTNNFSPIKSGLISFFLRAKKIFLLSEKEIKIKPSNVNIILVKKKLHKVFRNFKLIGKSNVNVKKLDTSMYFKNLRNTSLLKINKKSIGIHPGSNVKNGDKRWSINKYLKLINYYEKKNFQIYIFIGEYEKNLLEKFTNSSKKVKIVYGKNLDYVANLTSKLTFFVSNETGLAHLSSSLGVKTFVILNDKKRIERIKISIPIKNTIFINKTKGNSDLHYLVKRSLKSV